MVFAKAIFIIKNVIISRLSISKAFPVKLKKKYHDLFIVQVFFAP